MSTSPAIIKTNINLAQECMQFTSLSHVRNASEVKSEVPKLNSANFQSADLHGYH